MALRESKEYRSSDSGTTSQDRRELDLREKWFV